MQTRESDVIFAMKIINDICTKYNLTLIPYTQKNEYNIAFKDNMTNNVYLFNENTFLNK